MNYQFDTFDSWCVHESVIQVQGNQMFFSSRRYGTRGSRKTSGIIGFGLGLRQQLTSSLCVNFKFSGYKNCPFKNVTVKECYLKGLGHAILGNFSIDQMVIELTEITK